MTRGEVMRCEHVREAGAYVLGSLCPAERTRYERHLSVCPVCREEVAEIAVLPGLLGRLDPDAAGQVRTAGPVAHAAESRLPTLIEAAVRTRRRQTRTRRWRLAGASLVAAGLAALASVSLAPTGLTSGPGNRVGDRPMPVLVAMDPLQESPVAAEVGFRPAAGGTEVVMHCTYATIAEDDGPYSYRLVVVGHDGTNDQVSSWMAGAGTDLVLSGVTYLAQRDIARVELRTKNGEPVLVHNLPR